MESRIKYVRKKIAGNLTQSEFGERIGVKGNTVTGYETGIRVPTNAIITSICREFNVREEWLRYGIEPIEAPKSADAVDLLARQYNLGPGATALLRATAQAYAELDEKTCAIVINKMFESLQAYIQQNQASEDLHSQILDESPESHAASQ